MVRTRSRSGSGRSGALCCRVACFSFFASGTPVCPSTVHSNIMHQASDLHSPASSSKPVLVTTSSHFYKAIMHNTLVASFILRTIFDFEHERLASYSYYTYYCIFRVSICKACAASICATVKILMLQISLISSGVLQYSNPLSYNSTTSFAFVKFVAMESFI